MTYSEIKVLESLVKNELEKRFPVAKVYVSTLGGQDKASIMIKFSVDKSSTWANGIFENSRYFAFSISHKGEVECFTKSVDEIKIRKFTIEQPDKLLTKFIKVLDDIKTKTSKKITA